MTTVPYAKEVKNAAKMMDKAKPGWFRRIVFKRLNMQDGCNCIAGQSGLDWGEMEEAFDKRYPRATTVPFAAVSTTDAWIAEIRARRAEAKRDTA